MQEIKRFCILLESISREKSGAILKKQEENNKRELVSRIPILCLSCYQADPVFTLPSWSTFMFCNDTMHRRKTDFCESSDFLKGISVWAYIIIKNIMTNDF